MHTKRVILSGCLLVALLLPVLGDDVFSSYDQALGVQAGRLAGIGASYQKWYPTFGVQVAGGAFFHPNMEEGRDRYACNIGSEVQLPLISHTINSFLAGRVYLVAGLHHRSYQKAKDGGGGTYVPDEVVVQFGAGAGLAVETVLFEHFALTTEFVYVGLYTVEGSLDLDMYPQVAIRYRY